MKARNWLFDAERNISIGKKTEDDKNLFFKALDNRFWLTLKSYSWFNKIVLGQSSIKRTSCKGKLYVTKGILDLDFV